MKIQTTRANAREAGGTKAWEGGLLGFSGLGAGLTQGALYAKDAMATGVNKVAGTDLDNDSYDRFTKERKDIDQFHKLRREEAGQGFDVARLGGALVGEAPLAALGKGYQGAKILSKAGAKVTAQNAAAGAAMGGVGFADDAEQRMGNIGAGALGGAGGAVLGDKAGKLVANTIAKRQAKKINLSQIDEKIADVLKQSDIAIDDLPPQALDNIRQGAVRAIQSGKDLDAKSVQRLALLNSLGLEGTQGQVSRVPQVWQSEAELAKINRAGDTLRAKFESDNTNLSNLLDEVSERTGGNVTDGYGVASDMMDTASNILSRNKQGYNALYEQAVKAQGNDVVLDGAGFANDAITMLDQNYAMSSLPPSLHKLIKNVSANPESFTLGKSEEMVKILNREYKASLNNGQPTASTFAIGVVRDALNNRQDEALQGLLSQGGNDAAQLYSSARGAYKANAQLIEDIPLLQDVRKGVEPDKLFKKHVLTGDVAKLERTIKLLNEENPQVVNDMKRQVVEHIAERAINANGQFSPAGMKKALDGLTDRRLAILFTPQEMKRLKDIGMAAHYLISQPPHSAVNNSNTSSALTNVLLDRLKIPGVRVLAEPLTDIANSRQAKKALNPSIAGQTLPQQPNQELIQRLTQAGFLGGATATTD